ncbi:hypothetical protein KY289_023076 [Solanum tuberosum]|nr:hypothetical protein KY289_023076 [Solanum tuberosum]
MATRRAFSEDSLREILLSLRVKSLLRFKCVCKYWGNLINNPSFTLDHLNLSKKKKPPQHLIYDYGAANDAPTVTLADLMLHLLLTLLDIKLPFTYNYSCIVNVKTVVEAAVIPLFWLVGLRMCVVA